MRKTVEFERTIFPPKIWEEFYNEFEALLPSDDRPIDVHVMRVTTGNESWSFDSKEEFLAELRKDHDGASFSAWGNTPRRSVELRQSSYGSTVFQAMSSEREDLVRLSGLLERVANEYKTAPPPAPVRPPPRVFIGHGRSAQWRDLKDHLHEQHGYEVEAYESGARAGHTIRDILQQMVKASAFAVLVMTAEDETADGVERARQNVVHETGLFQGALGFQRAIVLLEEGAEDYSNLQGVHQIRYDRGRIRETFGDVLATLRREFGPER